MVGPFVRHRATSRSTWLLRTGAAAFAATAAAGFTALATGVASAAPAPTPRLVTGNVTTCAQAGLTGTILLSGGAGSASNSKASGTVTGLSLDVTVNAGFTASGIAVKGGNDAYVYDGPFVGVATVDDMVAPLNGGGNTPNISHWYVCGGPSASPSPSPSGRPSESPSASPSGSPSGSPSESPSGSPSASPSEPPSGSPTGSPSESPSHTPSESPSGSASTTAPPGPGGQLPTTGVRTGVLLGSGAALVAAGVLLLVLIRRQRRSPA